MPAYVYLLHFDEPYKHARHYMGSAVNLEYRISEHQNGSGARLMAVVKEAGITFVLARTWEFETEKEARHFERKLKKTHHRGKYCPLCRTKEPEVGI